MVHAWLIATIFVRMLQLPPGATIDPYGPRSLMSTLRDGSVTATVTLRGFLTRVAVWRDSAPRAQITTHESPTIADLRRFCEDFPQSSVGPVIAGILSDGSIVATMQSPAIVDLDDTSGQYAPVVLHLRSNQCLNMGNGVALGTAGMYTAGYTAYIASVPAPSNVISERERFVAMRWHDRTREPLGNGVAIAINDSGNAAGADVPPGKGGAFNATPHARIWLGTAPPIQPAETAQVSVAYAIDRSNRVTGMLQDTNGRHYAFLWQNGSLQRLDDVVRAPDWRFECGYAFAPDGSIIGVGTYRGTPAAFAVYGVP